MAEDTTSPSYWLNWRFLLCAIWVLLAVAASLFIIWRSERRGKTRSCGNGNQPLLWVLYEGETWGTCLRSVHPIWLLVYRFLAFCLSLALVAADIAAHGLRVFYFYTEWTFTLVAVYFGLGSAVSTYGCLLFNRKKAHSEASQHANADLEGNPHLAERNGENGGALEKKCTSRKYASGWEFALQIIFQITAGAVALTDTVFWLVLFPFFMRNRTLNWLEVSMHSINAVFILGEIILNKLHFPFFRIAYFALWTTTFVVFQWILHAFSSTRWPYPFLSLASPFAPLWYLAVGALLVPCFAVVWLIFKVKKSCLRKYLRESNEEQ